MMRVIPAVGPRALFRSAGSTGRLVARRVAWLVVLVVLLNWWMVTLIGTPPAQVTVRVPYSPVFLAR